MSLLSVSDVHLLLQSALSYKVVPLLDALNKTSAISHTSSINIPAYPTSTRDGYGWNSKWTTTTAIVQTSVYASRGNSRESYEQVFEEGTTCYIATGGIVSKSFDCVVMIEDVEEHRDESITLRTSSFVPKYIRAVGSDVRIGDVVCEKGVVIQPGDIALMASVGMKDVVVNCADSSVAGKQLHVAVVSTGDELAEIGDANTTDAVFDSNRPMLMSYLLQLQSQHPEHPLNINDLHIVRDAESHKLAEHLQTIANISRADPTRKFIVIGTGGASVGRKDFVAETLRTLGAHILITKVNMMPGKPFLFAIHPNFVYFGLAGNPVSSGVGYKLFVEPYIKRCMGINGDHQTLRVVVGFSTTVNASAAGRPEYHRVKLTTMDGKIVAQSTGNQASSSLKNLSCADALMCVDAAKGVKEGEEVTVILLRDFLQPFHPQRRLTKIGIVVMSDRASSGEYQDESGRAIEQWCGINFVNKHIITVTVIPDDIAKICDTIRELVRDGFGLILTTGGTGPTRRDNTPIAMKRLLDKELPGFGEQMRAKSLQYVPTAILSAQTAGVMYSTKDAKDDGGSLVINLPGSPKSIAECLDVIKGAIPYGVELSGGGWVEIDPPAFRGKRNK